ncbi:MAG: WecB/TagA/CpsF family glycosyltransferase [Candidatus Omnitrophica bacterium]|nr:WecB/TagA/CpsF family glycosyltransferase [Candidatus Omnitrophota bacterium]
MLKSIDILGVKIHETNINEVAQVVDNWIQTREKTYVCVANVDTIIHCQDHEDYREVINHASIATPDGMPLVWIGKGRGSKNIQRTYGPDLLLALCDKGQAKKYRHYFYGGTHQGNEKLIEQLKKRFPELNVVGCYAPAFLQSKEKESAQILEKINATSPDILWIGLGAPKQEHWMANHRSLLHVPVMIGVGAAFDFLSGGKPQAPRWMMRVGMEWCFRLCSEPKRLWKRYLIGNTRFLFLFLKDVMATKQKNKIFPPLGANKW